MAWRACTRATLVLALLGPGCGPASVTLPPRSSPAPPPTSAAAGQPDAEETVGPVSAARALLENHDRVAERGPLRRSLSADIVERRLKALMARRSRLYWPDRTASGVRCVEWQFERMGRDAHALSRRYRSGGAAVRESYGIAVRENLVSLSGPNTEMGNEGTITLCISELRVVDVGREQILMLRGGKAIAEYRTGDSETWFLSRAACEREGAVSAWAGCCGE
jgi:hypothetical protein